jgi:ubiquinone/menaquinone biosynthesis C-methylase UbiE
MNCDFVAPFYERMEHLCFGRNLERARRMYLAEVGTVRKALVCGGGDGRFLAWMLEANAEVQVDFVDLSAKMIAEARKRVARKNRANLKRVTFHHQDICRFSPRGAGYDLIATNFFLDCFGDEELREVIARLSSMSKPGARWIISEFRSGSGATGKIWNRGLVRSLYAGFRITTGLRVKRLPDYILAMKSCGYEALKESVLCAGLLHSSLWRAVV